MRSWLMTTNAPRNRASQSSSHSIAAMSRWLVGSSSNTTSGSCASARTIAARRRSPPLAVCASRVRSMPELVGDRLRLVRQRRVVAGEDIVGERREAGHLRVLFEQDHAGAGDDGAATLVGVDSAGDQLQERRLASAVAPDQRQPVARADVEGEVGGTATPNPEPGRGLRRRGWVRACAPRARGSAEEAQPH